MTSGFLSTSEAPLAPVAAAFSVFGVVGFDCESGTASRAGMSKSFVDFDGESDILLMSVPGVGGDAKSL